MTFYLGFDVAKLKHDYSLINEQGHEVCRGKIPNTETAVASLLESLQAKTLIPR